MPLDQQASLHRPPPPQADVEKSSPPRTHDQPLAWHILTCEYPPQTGGVSDYTYAVAAGLAAQGDEVHVWCPDCPGPQPQTEGVVVHRDFGAFRPSDLRRVGRQLDRYPAPRRILMQWVPHGYGYRSMNVAFCGWLWARAIRHRDRVGVMAHEVYHSFRAGLHRQNIAALVHRLMSILLLNASDRVWLSIPAWERRWRPYRLGRAIPFEWLPVPSNIPVVDLPERALAIRRRYAGEGAFLIGHFGTFGSTITALLDPILVALGDEPVRPNVLLMGRGSEEYRQAMIHKHPGMAEWVHAAGALTAKDLSLHIAACDLLMQPYPDGVSSRRGSLMAGLSHGKAIVTTVGSLSEPFWAGTGALAAVPAEDLEAFVASLRRLRADSAERLRLGRAAQSLYRERFDVQHVIKTLRAAAGKPDGEGIRPA
jgi:glycosyltransferase involved in cell wall biosynthesis